MSGAAQEAVTAPAEAASEHAPAAHEGPAAALASLQRAAAVAAAAHTRAGAGVPPPNTRRLRSADVMALQRAIGNRATARVLAREPATLAPPLPGSPEAGPRPLAVTLGSSIEQELAAARAQRLLAQKEADELEERAEGAKKSKIPSDAEEAIRIAALKKQLGTIDTTIKTGEADLLAINSPGTSEKSLNDMLARRNTKVATVKTEAPTGAATPGTGAGSWQLTDKGIAVGSAGEQSTQLIKTESGSKSVTKESASKTTIGFGTVDATDTSKTSVVQGEKTTSAETSKGKSVDVFGGSVGKSDSKKTTIVDPATGTDTSKEVANAKKLGLGGYESTNTVTEKKGSETTTTAGTFGVTRGDGKIGVGGTTSKVKGEVDDEGKLVKGTEKKGNLGGALIVDPEKGVGAGGDAGGNIKKVDGPKSYGGGGALSGKVLLNVVPVPGKSPPAFAATLTISFGIKVNVAGGYEKEGKDSQDAKTGTSGSASLSGGGNYGKSATFTRVLDEQTAKHYAEAVQKGGEGSKPDFPEWRILEVGIKGDWVKARELYDSMMSGVSADDAAKMKEGEGVETTRELGGEGKLGLGGKGGGISLGAEYGYAKKGALTFGFKVMPGGIMQVTVSASTESTHSGGATLGMGAAGMGVSGSSTTGAGQAVTFNLDQKDSQYGARYARIQSAGSMEEVQKLAADPDLKKSIEEIQESRSKGSTEGVKMTVGPATLELGGASTLDETTKKDADGAVVSTKVVGAYKGGGSVGVGDLKYGDSEKGAYTGETEKMKVVAPDGTVVEKTVAKGDLTQTTTASSWDKTTEGLANAWKTKSVAPLFGSPVKEATQTEGHKIHDQEIRAIVFKAKGDWNTWMKPVASPRLRPYWEQTRSDIQNACPGDDESKWDIPAVQRALATWRSEAHKGAEQAILSAGGGGGFAYHFPAGTETIQPLFEKLVGGYPAQKAELLQAEGKLADAKNEADARVGDAQKLFDFLISNEGKFEPSKYSSMLDGALKAKAKLEALQKSIVGKLTPPKANKPKPADKAEADKQAANEVIIDKAAVAAGALNTYHDMVDVCRKWQSAAQKLIREADGELTRGEGTFSSKADLPGIVYPKLYAAKDLIGKWDKKYWEAFRLMEEHGFDRAYVEKFHTAGTQGEYDKVYKRSTKW